MPERRPRRSPAPEPPPDQTTISAGFIRIFGLGTLIIGDSGVGKSESCLELVARGHRFIADDVVQVRATARGELVGTAPALSRNFMEIRGLGIINIRAIFGPRAIAREGRIDLVIRLKKWRRGYEVDRLGLKSGDDMTLLGRKIPQLAIPVAPGRNIATLIEIACKVHTLRLRGYSAPDEIIRRLDRALT